MEPEVRPLTGSCLCGSVRYEISGEPVWAHACHCSRCRKSSGAAFAPNLFFRREAFRFVAGEDLVRSYQVPEAERFTHRFCETCGSTLPFDNSAADLTGVPMGTLDDDPQFALRAHIFTDSKAPWHSIEDDLPQHPAALGSGNAAPKTSEPG